MAVIRVLVTTQVTLTHTFVVDETPTDAAGAVTVTVKRLDGTTVTSGPAGHPGTGQYTFVLPDQAAVDILLVTWAGSVAGGDVVVTDAVEIVGGHIFDIGTARARHQGLQDATRYTTAYLAERRIAVEHEAEAEGMIGHAVVPRFARVLLSGNGRELLATPHLLLRNVRACTINGTAMSAPDVAALIPLESGCVARPGYALWPYGRNNIVMEVEHGRDRPPADVEDAAILRLRSVVGQTTTSIPDRAVSFTVSEGGVYRLAVAGPRATGIPEVDAAYHRAQIDVGGFA